MRAYMLSMPPFLFVPSPIKDGTISSTMKIFCRFRRFFARSLLVIPECYDLSDELPMCKYVT
jgi:hypothetical protein